MASLFIFILLFVVDISLKISKVVARWFRPMVRYGNRVRIQVQVNVNSEAHVDSYYIRNRLEKRNFRQVRYELHFFYSFDTDTLATEAQGPRARVVV